MSHSHTAVVSESAPSRALPPATVEEVNASCRAPVLHFFWASGIWLAFAALSALVGLMKLHAPLMLATCPFLSYGHLYQAQSAAFIYGFASQAAMGLSLWMIARLGRTPLFAPPAAFISGVIWNLAAVLGVIGIFIGDSSGYERFELPAYSAWPLFIAFVVFAVSALVTLHQRRERELYPSLWFLMGGIFTFGWVFSTAVTLLLKTPLRSSALPVVGLWYSNAVVSLWIVPVGIAILTYFIPRLSGAALYSTGLGAFAFWLQFLAGGTTGFHASGGLPRWLVSVSAVGSVLMLAPALANIMNWQHSSDAKSKPQAGLSLFKCAAIAYGLAAAMQAFTALPSNNALVGLTWFKPALANVWLYGFFGVAAVAAMSLVASGLLDGRLSDALLLRPAWLTVAGSFLLTIPLMIGGMLQGKALLNAATPFMATMKTTLPWIGIAMIGFALVAAGGVLFLVNLFRMVKASVMGCLNPVAWFTKEVRR